MTARGHQVFVGELARFAGDCDDARVRAIAQTTAAPLRVAVYGRRGAGRPTVARALAHVAGASGITVMRSGAGPDLVVYVLAEVVKPEDADAIAAAGCPVLAVLNKADLLGPLSGSGAGPLTAARRRCTHLAELAGVPVEPIIGLLAVAAFEGFDEHALRTLAAHPNGSACLDGSFEGFLTADNPLAADARLRLLDSLDMFGTALGVAAVRRGGTSAGLRALLRRVSGVDAVVARLSAVAAELRYRRLLDAVAELEALAVGHAAMAVRIHDFLTHDDTVLARMAAALDVAEAVDLDAGRSELHRACGADIARGSLRLRPGASR